ncbi:hypothetical protein AB0912_27350 [Streptomyces sp. NPDC007084]|uniref:hypothetical protein n=1 Tax=Streptomyces sp. NPDC007084 TaxID=3154313 RepID=UPI0034571C8A
MAETLGTALPAAELVDAARSVVSSLARPDFLRGLIAELAAGEGDTAHCAERSYQHVLGFRKLLLIDAGAEHRLRAHLWQAGNDAVGGKDVHNHRSALASHVVRGRLRMELYERAPGPEADTDLVTTAYEERLPERHAGWLLTPRGTARLRLLHTAHYAAGSSYALPAHTLHRASCDPGEPTVTLFLETGGGRLGRTDVFSPAGARPASMVKSRISAEDYLAGLGALAALL